jgi:hypothetical protein
MRYELELRAMCEFEGSVGFEIGVGMQAFGILGMGPAVAHYNFIPKAQAEYHKLYMHHHEEQVRVTGTGGLLQ